MASVRTGIIALETIAVDGRCLVDRFPGIGRYLHGLLRALPDAMPGTRIRVLIGAGRNTRFDLGRLDAAGIELVRVRAPLRGLAQQVALPRRLRDLGAEVFHAPYLLTAYRVPCPLVVNLYDTIAARDPRELRSPLARLVYRLGTRLALRSARRIVTLTEAAKADLVELYRIAPERVVVTPAAPAPELRPASETAIRELKHRLDLPARYVLHLGTDRPHKNLARLVEAWATVRAAHPDLVLVLAGARAHERRGRLRDGVGRLGVVAEKDLAALYGGAELFVLPSLAEGFGLPVVEAMACGAPVACSEIPALREVAGEAAETFDPRAPASIAAALRRLLASPERREDLRRRGLARAASFSWARTAEATAEVYRSATIPP